MTTTVVQQLAVTVPEGALPGSILSIPVKGSDNVRFRVPEGYVPGSTLIICKDETTGEWAEAGVVSNAAVAAAEPPPPGVGDQQQPPPPIDAMTGDELYAQTGPPPGERLKVESFTVRMSTLAGVIDIIVRPDWAPHGARRFLEMAALGDLDNLAFYRAIPGCIAQFGLPERRAWPPLPDDPLVGVPFLLGAVCFAAEEPNSRRSTLFICTGDMRSSLGREPWETPIGAVAENSLETLDHIETMYGEVAEYGGYGPEVRRIEQEGDTYLRMHFPLLTYVKVARPLDWQLPSESSSANAVGGGCGQQQPQLEARPCQEVPSAPAAACPTPAPQPAPACQAQAQEYAGRHPQQPPPAAPQPQQQQQQQQQQGVYAEAPARQPQSMPQQPPAAAEVTVEVAAAPQQGNMLESRSIEVQVEVAGGGGMQAATAAAAATGRGRAREVPVEVSSQPRSGSLEVPVEVAVSARPQRHSFVAQAPPVRSGGGSGNYVSAASCGGSYAPVTVQSYGSYTPPPQGTGSTTPVSYQLHTQPLQQQQPQPQPYGVPLGTASSSSYMLPISTQLGGTPSGGEQLLGDGARYYSSGPYAAGCSSSSSYPVMSAASHGFAAPSSHGYHSGPGVMHQPMLQPPPPPGPPSLQPPLLPQGCGQLQPPSNLRMPQLNAPMLGPVPALKAPTIDAMSPPMSLAPNSGSMMLPPWGR